MFGRKKPSYHSGELLIYNLKMHFGNEDDRLFMVGYSELKKLDGDSRKKMYYSGTLLKMKETKSPGVPNVPVFDGGILNIEEATLCKIEEILKKEKTKKKYMGLTFF